MTGMPRTGEALETRPRPWHTITSPEWPSPAIGAIDPAVGSTTTGVPSRAAGLDHGEAAVGWAFPVSGRHAGDEPSEPERRSQAVGGSRSGELGRPGHVLRRLQQAVVGEVGR